MCVWCQTIYATLFSQGGGASSTVTLTAFVLTSISEVRLRSTEIRPRLASAKTKAQSYLESNAATLSDPYSLALVSYALFKSGSNNVDLTLRPLNRLAKNEGRCIGKACTQIPV